MEVLGFDLGPIVPFILIGFAAQMVDGALGMAFGVITNTLMVGLLGVPPALASQRVHLVECFTTATSGISHLLHGNIDRALFFRLLVPGVIGGLVGTYLITSIDGDTITGTVGAGDDFVQAEPRIRHQQVCTFAFRELEGQLW